MGAGNPARHLVALALLIVLGALLWTSERGRSITLDEPLHLLRGQTYWWIGDSSLSYAHPPLANLIVTAPQLRRGERNWGDPVDEQRKKRKGRNKRQRKGDERRAELSYAQVVEQSPSRHSGNVGALANGYFSHNFRVAKAEVIAARRAMMVMSVAFGLLLYLWAARRWGWLAGVFGLALFTLYPTIVAHGRLVTTDMPLALGAGLSLAALIAWIERPGWSRAGLFALASTFMVLCKHSGLPLVVLSSLVLIAAAALGAGGFEGSTGRERLRATGLVLLQLSCVAAFMILMIDAIYLFDRVGLSVAEILAEPEPKSWLSEGLDGELLEHSPLAALPADLRLPFPYTWLVGLATVARQNELGHGSYFFELNDEPGHPLYFPVLLLAKCPLGLLALVLAGAVLLGRRVREGQPPSVATRVLVLVGALVLLGACRSNINIGVRHVLLLMPLAAVLGGRAAQLLVEGGLAAREQWRGKLQLGFVLAALLACVGGAASTFPHYLGDFNVLVGGPEGGHEISIVGEDWGQDLYELADYLEEEEYEKIAYYGSVPIRRMHLRERGIELVDLPCTRLPEDRSVPMVIHVDHWKRRSRCFRSLRERDPIARINHHILVFEAIPKPELPAWVTNPREGGPIIRKPKRWTRPTAPKP